MSFGEQLRKRREELGISRVELAGRLGISRSAVGNYETGVTSPFNLTSIRSFSSPSPITMSTSCPLGIAFAVRPSAVAFSFTQPFSSCTKPFARSTWPHAGSVKRAGIFCSSCWHERPSSKK